MDSNTNMDENIEKWKQLVDNSTDINKLLSELTEKDIVNPEKYRFRTFTKEKLRDYLIKKINTDKKFD